MLDFNRIENRETHRINFTVEKAKLAVEVADMEWVQAFLAAISIARVPKPIWNVYVGLKDSDSYKLLGGSSSTLTPVQINTCLALTTIIEDMVNTGLLPCSDTRCYKAMFDLKIKASQDAVRLAQLTQGDMNPAE